jgi:predicted metal-dependent phosphoesterase TrpH
LIDLHTHTNESDGTYSPNELVQAAVAQGLDALGITDHDTFAGYDSALPEAQLAGLDLICGIELSTRMGPSGGRAVHMLAYFVDGHPSEEFRNMVVGLQSGRRERNARLIQRLNSMGVEIALAEVEALGRSLAGRPHFAKILVQKGYAKSTEEVFHKFIGEDAPGYVERDSPPISDAIQDVINGGGIPVLAHPIRLAIRDSQAEEAVIGQMRDYGLQGIEVYHSDHKPADVARYEMIAQKYGLVATGGSDFHGENKPLIALGTGLRGNVRVPKAVLDRLREVSTRA